MGLSKEQTAFLKAFVVNGTVTHAAEAVGLTRQVHYNWLENDEYEAAWRDAQEAATDRLEKEAIRRAVDGLKRFKFDKHGEPIKDPETGLAYYELEYSDRLLEMLLKANRPHRFANKHEISGPNGGPVDVQHSIGELIVGNQELSDGLCDALENAVERKRAGSSEG